MVRAAIKAGYGIEIDLQVSADGRAMVFHDDELRDIPDFERVGASFISHEASDVTRDRVLVSSTRWGAGSQLDLALA